jgi:Domain of unknown function (DUF4160)
MPEISRFYGIVIRMYPADHNPPHFHAFYAEHMAMVDIRTGAVISGGLPPRAIGLVSEWTSIHRDGLLDLWARAQRLEPLHRIAPLA